MSQESLPPLRIREEDGSPNAIPVFEIIVSNGTLVQDGPGRVRLATGAGAAPAVYAATGNSYILISNAADLTADRALAASTGLTLVDAGTDSTVSLSVNSNVRDKMFGWFGAGNVATTMFVEESRVRIPFNMQPVRMDAAITTTATGVNVIVNLLQFATPIAAGVSMFTSTATQVNIPPLFSAGSATSFDAVGTLFTGSYLGISLTQVGSPIAGSNLTITLIARAS